MDLLLVLASAAAAAAVVLLWPAARKFPCDGPAVAGVGRVGAARALDPAVVADLVAAALGAGVSPSAAVLAVADSVARVDGTCEGSAYLAADLRRLAAGVRTGDLQLAGTATVLGPLRDAVVFAVRTGTPAAEPLRHAAFELRRAREAAAAGAANRLAARLVLPLGLAALPGFLLLGIAPVVLHLLSSPLL